MENAESLITKMLFDPKRYDLARVGRYKYNKKLEIKERIKGHTLEKDVVDPRTGEILAVAGDVISKEKAEEIDRAGVNRLELIIEGQNTIVFSNDMVYLSEYVDFDVNELNVKVDKVRRTVLQSIIDAADGDEDEIKRQIEFRMAELSPKHITIDDIFASVNYCLNLAKGTGSCDDIDHLGNRRLRCVGELLQNQFRIGLS